MEHVQWIDALEFNDYGGWKKDTQFTHLMGSGYLLACEQPGVPVEDATTTFTVPEEGMYRVWVRSKNWYYTYAPGKFNIAVNGAASPVVLGALPSNDWLWQIAGDFSLSAGEHSMALQDVTGYFGRCSTVVVTNDMSYVPPRPTQEFEAERARCKGLSLEPVNEGSYDVIVVGAGPGGVPSAIAAARHGAKTLLIQNRSLVGGNASEEGGVSFNGACARQPNARDGGIAEEMIRLKGHLKCSWSTVMQMMCDAEENITVICNMHVCGADTKDGAIQSVIARHTEQGTRHQFFAKYFIDCTGDSWVGYYAGAKLHIGREAKWQAQEEFAPEQADLLTMSGTLMQSNMFNTGAPVPYVAPEWVPKFPEGKKFGRNIEHVGSVWWAEAPNDLDDIYDAELARDEIFRLYLGYFNYLKNLWDEKERAENYIYKHINYIDSKRESRRIVGDYMLTQNDCMSGRVFEDTIAQAGWPIDLHHPKGIYSGEEGPFFSNTHVPLVSLPYRCIYSTNISNLFMAGRNMSVTHVALGTTRLQATIANMGQAAGTAACMCIQKGITPREVGQLHFAEFQQQLLKDDIYIASAINEDKADLARNATVTATSVNENEAYRLQIGYEGELLPLDRQRATFFARDVAPRIDSVWVRLTNTTDAPIPLAFHLREQVDPDGYTTEEDLLLIEKEIPVGENWIELPVNLDVELRYLWIWVDATPGLAWRIWRFPALDWTRSERDKETDTFRNIRGQTHCLALTKPVEAMANCAPENVINGYSRAMSPQDYAWVSDPEQGLPQSLSLSFAEPTTMNSVHITFDTDMTNKAMLMPITPCPEQMVTAYRLMVEDAQGWHEVANVTENCLRKKVHSFAESAVKQVKIVVENSGDEKTARIFEVRAYHET